MDEEYYSGDEDEEDFYKSETREELLDDDKISNDEAGFMNGYDNAYDQQEI